MGVCVRECAFMCVCAVVCSVRAQLGLLKAEGNVLEQRKTAV